jgi:hypothetical protein
MLKHNFFICPESQSLINFSPVWRRDFESDGSTRKDNPFFDEQNRQAGRNVMHLRGLEVVWRKKN